MLLYNLMNQNLCASEEQEKILKGAQREGYNQKLPERVVEEPTKTAEERKKELTKNMAYIRHLHMIWKHLGWTKPPKKTLLTDH